MFTVNSNDIKSFGTVDISALFANISADSITVPVAANGSSGTTYTVLLSTGEQLSITCSKEGELDIPFKKGDSSVTFIICTAEQQASALASDLLQTEQAHTTVMSAEVGMAALSAGNDFIGAATEGLGLASNIGADGVSSFAQMGGGALRQETG